MPQIRNQHTEQDKQIAKYRNWTEHTDTYENDRITTDESSEHEHEHEHEHGATYTPFVDLLQRDPCICDHCFIRRYDAESHEWRNGNTGWLTFQRWHTIPTRSTTLPAETGSKTTLACSNCGHQTGEKTRPISSEKLTAYAENIIQTIREKNIPINEDVFHAQIHEHNTSANQGRVDSHIYAPALRAAIYAAHTQTEAESDATQCRENEMQTTPTTQ